MFDFDSPTPSESSDQDPSERSALAIKTTSGANRFLFPGAVQHRPANQPQSLPPRIPHSTRLQSLEAPTHSIGLPSKRKEPAQTFPELRAELNQAFSIRDIQVPVTKQLSSSVQGNPISATVGTANSSLSFATNPALYSRHKGVTKGYEDRHVLPPLKHTDKAPVLSQTDSNKFNKVPSNPLVATTQRNWNVPTGFSYSDTTKRRLLSPAAESGTVAKRPNQYNPSPVTERHMFRKQISKENRPSVAKPPHVPIGTGTMPSLTERKQRRKTFKENSISHEYSDTFLFNS